MSWSDWQDPWPMPIPVTPEVWPFAGHLQSAFPSSYPPDLASAQALMNSLLADIPSSGAEAATSRRWLQSRLSPDARLRLGYAGGDLDATGHDGEIVSDLPTPLTTLTLGTDYEAAPDWTSPTTLRPNQYVEYEDTTTAFAAWDDLDVEIILSGGWDGIDFPDPLGFTFWATTPQPDQNVDEIDDPTRPWLAYEDGTVLTHYDFPGVPTPPQGPTFSATATVNLSAWTDPTLALVWMPRALDPAGDIPVPPAYGPSPWNLIVIPENPDPMLPTATARYSSPRWRYWTGGPLRTVGDHFRSVGGADVKSLQADGTWQKVRRGT